MTDWKFVQSHGHYMFNSLFYPLLFKDRPISSLSWISMYFPEHLPSLDSCIKSIKLLSKNPNETIDKLISIIDDGPNVLKYVCDFDYTISPFYTDASMKKRGLGCHNIVEDSIYFRDELREKSKALREKYYPLELNLDIPFDEKAKLMLEWTDSSHELILNSGITRDILNQMIWEGIETKHIGVRKHVPEFIRKVKSHQIPMMIFSGGIADILQQVLVLTCDINAEELFTTIAVTHDIIQVTSEIDVKLSTKIDGNGDFRQSLYSKEEKLNVIQVTDDSSKSFKASELEISKDSNIILESKIPSQSSSIDILNEIHTKTTKTFEQWDGIHVISNRCIFSREHPYTIQDFYKPSLHILNKKSAYFKESEYYFKSHIEESHPNVILIGDSPSDVLMIEGMTYDPKKCLKIGFLNDEDNISSERLDLFLSIYDIVILGDEAGFEIPMALLDKICDK